MKKQAFLKVTVELDPEKEEAHLPTQAGLGHQGHNLLQNGVINYHSLHE